MIHLCWALGVWVLCGLQRREEYFLVVAGEVANYEAETGLFCLPFVWLEVWKYVLKITCSHAKSRTSHQKLWVYMNVVTVAARCTSPEFHTDLIVWALANCFLSGVLSISVKWDFFPKTSMVTRSSASQTSKLCLLAAHILKLEQAEKWVCTRVCGSHLNPSILEGETELHVWWLPGWPSYIVRVCIQVSVQVATKVSFSDTSLIEWAETLIYFIFGWIGSVFLFQNSRVLHKQCLLVLVSQLPNNPLGGANVTNFLVPRWVQMVWRKWAAC